MARRLWPARNAIGERFKIGPPDADRSWFTVIGVVGNMRRQGLDSDPGPQMFEPLAQNPSRLVTLLVRTSVDDPAKMAGAIRAAARRADQQTALYGAMKLEDQLGRALGQRRFLTWLLIAFSIVALAMAVIGIYGLIQYSVATRTYEIGIRMAIGAPPGRIFRMIIGEGLALTLAGLGLGLIGALCLGRTASALLFGITAFDPPTLAGVSLLLTAVAAAACYFPSRSAMRIEPSVALRQS